MSKSTKYGDFSPYVADDVVITSTLWQVLICWPEDKDSAVSSLLRSMLRTEPGARQDNAEEALAHPFFIGHAPAPANQIVRAAWKAGPHTRPLLSSTSAVVATVTIQRVPGLVETWTGVKPCSPRPLSSQSEPFLLLDPHNLFHKKLLTLSGEVGEFKPLVDGENGTGLRPARAVRPATHRGQRQPL
jgi:hypothetical protein